MQPGMGVGVVKMYKPSEVAWVKTIDKLSDDHIEVMKQCENGSTIWGFETVPSFTV